MSQLSLLVDNPDAARKSRQLVVFAKSPVVEVLRTLEHVAEIGRKVTYGA
jgi:hypothetical protein